MPPLLTYVLTGAVLVLTVALIPLLQQLQRTAASTERFLDGAKEDLHRIQADIHATRERLDTLAGSAQGAVDQLQGLVRHMADLGAGLEGSVDGLLGRMGGGSGFGLGGLLGTLGALLAFLRRPKATGGEA